MIRPLSAVLLFTAFLGGAPGLYAQQADSGRVQVTVQESMGMLGGFVVEAAGRQDIAVLVIDEAQTLTEGALVALRDLIAVAENRAPQRMVVGPSGPQYVPSGLGVLLLGTYDLEVRLSQSEEAGRRWVRAQRVGPVAAADAPVVFRKLLPAFDKAAKALGAKAWADVVTRLCTDGRDIPIATIENIIRIYTRRMVIDVPGIATVADIPWDVELFEQACGELFRKVIHIRAA